MKQQKYREVCDLKCIRGKWQLVICKKPIEEETAADRREKAELNVHPMSEHLDSGYAGEWDAWKEPTSSSYVLADLTTYQN